MSKWYGSINNRIEENRMFTDEIKVGTGVTEYSWSDRTPYEVTEVISQKKVKIRRMKWKRPNDGNDYSYSNKWVITSDETAPEFEIVKRGKYWYSVSTCTPELAQEILDGDDIDAKLWMSLNGFLADEIIASGKAKKKFHKMNISFGKAERYYDYEF